MRAAGRRVAAGGEHGHRRATARAAARARRATCSAKTPGSTDTVAALRADDLPAVGRLLNASHASLRDQYEVSTPAVEATVERLLEAGAAGARIVGGGFGGHVLGLLAPSVHAPSGAREVRAGKGAHLLLTGPPYPRALT